MASPVPDHATASIDRTLASINARIWPTNHAVQLAQAEGEEVMMRMVEDADHRRTLE